MSWFLSITFAAQLKSARTFAGLTIAEAARVHGVSPRTWIYWESGRRAPPRERDAITRERLLAALAKVNRNELSTEEGTFLLPET